MKSSQFVVNPDLVLLISRPLSDLSSICEERDSAIEEELETQAELKFKAVLDVKKKLNLKIALAQKSQDQDQTSIL